MGWKTVVGLPFPEEEVLGYFKSLSNWGRWGADDQLGAPNLITPAVTKRAAGLVEDGVRISMSRTISFEPSADAPAPPVHLWQEGRTKSRGLGK